MELVRRFSDASRISRALFKESQGDLQKGLEYLLEPAKSIRYKSIIETYRARLLILTREKEYKEVLPNLRESEWFKSPIGPYEEYCADYVVYFDAKFRDEQAVVDKMRKKLAAAPVKRFVRSCLLVT